jgi:protein SCO1
VFLIGGSAGAVFLTPPKPLIGNAKLEGPRQIRKFELIERSGRTVSESDLLGHVCVVGFVFTSCGLTCREVAKQMAEIAKLEASNPDVRLVSITTDPRTDTPAVLTRFAAEYGADANRWLFLTGEKSRVYDAVERSFLNKNPAPIDGEDFAGTERILLTDDHGAVMAAFEGMSSATPRAVAAAIEVLRGRRWMR